jgi:hypothetical protein
MLNKKKHTLFFVAFHLLIFLTPLIVKASHHHNLSENNKENHGIVVTNNLIEHCLICDYEFSINDIPKSQPFEVFDFFFTQLISSSIQNGYLTGIGNLIPPRAPPLSA